VWESLPSRVGFGSRKVTRVQPSPTLGTITNNHLIVLKVDTVKINASDKIMFENQKK